MRRLAIATLQQSTAAALLVQTACSAACMARYQQRLGGLEVVALGSHRAFSTSPSQREGQAKRRLAFRLTPGLEAQIAKIAQRSEALEQQMQGSDAAGQQLSGSQLQEAMREYKQVQPVGSKYSEYQRLRQELRDVQSLLQPAAPAAAGPRSPSLASPASPSPTTPSSFQSPSYPSMSLPSSPPSTSAPSPHLSPSALGPDSPTASCHRPGDQSEQSAGHLAGQSTGQSTGQSAGPSSGQSAADGNSRPPDARPPIQLSSSSSPASSSPASKPPYPTHFLDPDEELRQLVHEEAGQLSERLREVEEELLLALLPSAREELMGAIVEVRAGTGGDEAALFAAELARMYQRYAEHKGWHYEVLEQSASDAGGLKFASAAISGPGAFARLHHEAGVHRVQRVPATENQGRIHTSTASVVVLPEADEDDFVVREEDVKMEAHRSSGAGGQSVNTTNSAVRLTHLPSGLVVTCSDERSQQRNRAKALRVLRARLLQAERQRLESRTSAERRASIGSGDRHERIRTYNFPQDRVTDHRVGVTLHGLDDLLSGEGGDAQAAALDAIIDALTVQEQTRRLEELSEAL